jgi:hypothetical protein
VGVFLFGLAFSIAVKKTVIKVGEKIDVHNFTKKIGLQNLLLKFNIHSAPSIVIARFLQGWIFTIFLLTSTQILKLDPVSDFLEDVINFLPNVVVALFIMLFAVRFGDFLSGIVMGAFYSKDSHAGKILSLVCKNIIVAFGALVALNQMHIASEFIKIIFIGLISMVSLAGGLAFGLGGKEVVYEFLEDLRNQHKEELKTKKSSNKKKS